MLSTSFKPQKVPGRNGPNDTEWKVNKQSETTNQSSSLSKFDSSIYIYKGFLSHGGTPSHHPSHWTMTESGDDWGSPMTSETSKESHEWGIHWFMTAIPNNYPIYIYNII